MFDVLLNSEPLWVNHPKINLVYGPFWWAGPSVQSSWSRLCWINVCNPPPPRATKKKKKILRRDCYKHAALQIHTNPSCPAPPTKNCMLFVFFGGSCLRPTGVVVPDAINQKKMSLVTHPCPVKVAVLRKDEDD